MYNSYNYTMEKTQILAYFAKMGVSRQIGAAYLALHKHGPQTMSELARSSGVDRIQLYRLIDEMRQSGLIEIETSYKRSILRAAPIGNIQVIIAKKEQELRDLQRGFAAVNEHFASSSLTSGETRVQFYEGIDGLKQMLWQQTKSTSENLAILYDNMQFKTNQAFFERWVRACNEKDIRFKGIVSDHFIATQQQWYRKRQNEQLQHWESRHVTNETFPIRYSIVTFDDTVLHWNWNDERVFGIAITNPEIAAAQRQFFKLLWEKATPTTDELVRPR